MFTTPPREGLQPTARPHSAPRDRPGEQPSEIANATGIATGTVSTLLTKLSKSGEVVKAERGYRLPERPQCRRGLSARHAARALGAGIHPPSEGAPPMAGGIESPTHVLTLRRSSP
jgi:hypothetical protein